MVGAQRSDMTEQAKPKGIIVLAALYLVSGGVYIVLLTLWIVAPETLSSILGALTPGGVTEPERLLVLGAYLPVYFSVMGVFTAALAYGMWTLQELGAHCHHPHHGRVLDWHAAGFGGSLQ